MKKDTTKSSNNKDLVVNTIKLKLYGTVTYYHLLYNTIWDIIPNFTIAMFTWIQIFGI